MSDINITITNLPQIKRAFDVAPFEMTKQLNLAIRKTILKIQAKSMINTPVLTGRLRASTASTFGDLRGEVGTHTNYDIFVHEGTRFMKGRPYLRDAVDESSDDTDKYFQEAVQNTLDKIAGMV